MHPTIDQQLAGARRLLAKVVDDPDLPSDSLALLANADRLISQVARVWATQPDLYRADNAAMTELLRSLNDADAMSEPDTTDKPGIPTDPRGAAEENALLRSDLSARIRDLPEGPAGDVQRQNVLAHLRGRLAAGLV